MSCHNKVLGSLSIQDNLCRVVRPRQKVISVRTTPSAISRQVLSINYKRNSSFIRLGRFFVQWPQLLRDGGREEYHGQLI